MHFIFATTSTSYLSISIAFRCASTIAFTSVDCCTTTCTLVDGCTYASTMISSLEMSTLSMLLQGATPQLCLPLILQWPLDLLMYSLVLYVLLHANIFCLCAKTQLQMFQLYLCLELLSTQTIASHYTPSILHISKMMMNATTTAHPTAEYSTCLLSLFFSIVLLLLFFSTIPFPPLIFIYVHFFALPFPLLFAIVFQWHSLHSCCCEF